MGCRVLRVGFDGLAQPPQLSVAVMPATCACDWQPRWVERWVTKSISSWTSYPAKWADAGFVPWAVSGARTIRRFSCPLSRKYARITLSDVHSPCAPAQGWSDTSASPLMRKLDGRHYEAKLTAHEQDLIRYWPFSWEACW